MKKSFIFLAHVLIVLQLKNSAALEEKEDLDNSLIFDELRDVLLNEESEAELKEYTQNWVNKSPNSYLKLWLDLFDFDVEKTKNHILKSLKWRVQYKIDDLSKWTPPDYIRDNFKSIIVPRKNDYSLFFMPYGNWKIREVVQLGYREDFQKMNLKMMDNTVRLAHDYEYGQNETYLGFIMIADMDGFSLLETLSIRVVSLTAWISSIYQNNYPLHFRKIYAINVPSYFSTLLGVIKRVVNAKIFNDIQLFSDYPQEEIEALFPLEILPKKYGGGNDFI